MAGKRSNKEGSVRKMKNGTWRGELMDGYTADGKRNIKNFYAATKTEVLQLIRGYWNERDKLISSNKELNFATWADCWYEDYKSQVQASTYSGYRYTLKLLKNHLGGHLMHKLLPIHINKVFDKLVEEGYSMSQIRKCRAMLIQICDAAENNDLISTNPARKAKIVKDITGELSAPRREKDAFTDEEIAIMERDLPDDLLGHSICFLIGTGIRVQELLALFPSDIAKDGSSVNIDKAIKTVDGIPTIGVPKSRKSIRVVPIPKNVRHHAVYIREHGCKDIIWRTPGKTSCPGVGVFRERYYRALKKLTGVRLLSPHCCRHTYITRLQERGVPMETISQLAGHSSTSTTCGYTHISMHSLEDAVSVLDNEGSANNVDYVA